MLVERRDNEMKKRVLSLLFAALLVVSLLPVTAFAEECTKYVSASGNDATGTGAADAPFATIQKAIDSIPNSGTVILLSDLNVSTAASNNYAFEILDGKDITLDGGGYKVKMNNAVRPFCVSVGKLTLTDVDIDMNGHQYNQLNDGKYTIQVLQDGELVLNDGAIIENAKYGAGFTNFSIRGTATMNDGAIIRNMEGLFGAIRVEGYDDTSGFGNFYMNGGLITGCTSESYGYEGVVFYISVGGKMVMTGGTITGNQDKANSPGTIFLHANNMGARGYNEFTATGGTITGNSAIYGGVVYTNNNVNKINISGNVNFTGNTGTEFGGESNLYLGSDLLVNLEGGMGENSMVGVYTSSVPSNTADVKFAFNAAKADAGHFISDKMSTSGIIYDDGEKCWNAAGNEIIGYHHVNEANTLWLSTAAAGYAVDISSEIEHGTVTPNLKCFCPGDTVTLTVTPSSGYMLTADSLKVFPGKCAKCGEALSSAKCAKCGESHTPTALNLNQDGTYTFTMPSYAVTVTAEFEEVPVHTHTFTYTANDGKLTATCTQGCDKGYDTTPLTLTLTAPASLVYDGNAKAFTFADGEAAAWTGAGLELPTITYYQKQVSSGTYSQLDKARVDAGDYMVEITVNKKAARFYFTIDKATPYIKTNPAPTDINYGDKLSKSTLAGGYVQASSTKSAEVGGLFEWTNPDTMPAIADSEVTLYDVTFTPADTNNYNSVSCKVTITVNHTHNLVKVDGQAATEEAAGWKDYYECKDNEGALGCGVLFEDADGNTPIDNLDTWKAQNGNGYIAQLVHTITPVSGKDATDTEAGFKPYYECKNCGKYYEDEEGKVEITDISAWKAEGGDGYIPSGNEIAAAKDAAKKALDAENAKDPLLNEITLTNGKSVIDSATTLEDIENAKKEAIAAIQEAQADELAAAKTAAKKVLDEENAKDPLLDDSSVVNGKSAIDKAATKAAVESAKEEAIAAIQEAQKIQPVDYIITKGSNVKINLTKLEDTLFTSNADFSKFKEVLVDGKVIDQKYYDAKSGSTDITLKKAYLKTLAVGEHTLTIASTDGSASTKFYIYKAQDPSPDTGDNTNIALWSALTTVSFAVLIAYIEELKKKKKHNL